MKFYYLWMKNMQLFYKTVKLYGFGLSKFNKNYHISYIKKNLINLIIILSDDKMKSMIYIL